MSTPAAVKPEPGADHVDRWLVGLGLAILVGAVLRILRLSDSLFGDELVTSFDVTGRSLGGTLDAVRSNYEITPPLYLLLANLTQGWGDPETGLRIVPLVCGVLAIPMTWALGVLALDRRAATVAAGVVALTPMLIFYGTEARAYGLAMVLLLGSTLALWHALHGGVRAWWGLYAALTCAAMYTHYTAAFVLIGQGGWALVFHRRAWRWIFGANAVAAVAWLPWLSSYRDDQANPASRLIGFLRPFDLGTFKTDVLHWVAGLPFSVLSVRDMPGDVAIALMVLGGAGAVAAVGWELRRAGRPLRAPSEGQALVAVLALSAPVIAAVYSVVGVSVFAPRNLTGSSPGLALVLGALVTLARGTRLWVPGAVLLLAGFAIGGARMGTNDAQRSDFAGAAAFISARGGPDAVVVDVPGSTPGPLTHLDAASAPGVAAPLRPVILRLGRAPRAVELVAGRPGGVGQFAALAVPTPQAIARQAERSARGRDIYLVRLGDQPPTVSPVIPPFLAALAPRYAPAGERRFPGLFGKVPVTVTVLRRVQAR